MFWRKKKEEAAPAEGKGAAEKVEKLPGPKMLPEIVGNHIIKNMEKDSGWTWRLSAVMRPRAGGGKAFDVRIFATYEAAGRNIKVKDYTTLDEHPELILFEGWFDKDAKKVELVEKRVIPKVTIYTQKEILQQIEALTEPGSKVHFYLCASPASGGPLERGAGVVELNPKYPDKGQKKYILYCVSMEGMELTSKSFRMLDSDSPKDVARWIKERHFKVEGSEIR